MMLYYLARRLVVGTIFAGVSIYGIASGLGWSALLLFLPLLAGSAFVFAAFAISPLAETSLPRMAEVYFGRRGEHRKLRTRALACLGLVYGVLACLWTLLGVMIVPSFSNARLGANYMVAGALVFMTCSFLFFSASAVLGFADRLRARTSSHAG